MKVKVYGVELELDAEDMAQLVRELKDHDEPEPLLVNHVAYRRGTYKRKHPSGMKRVPWAKWLGRSVSDEVLRLMKMGLKETAIRRRFYRLAVKHGVAYQFGKKWKPTLWNAYSDLKAQGVDISQYTGLKKTYNKNSVRGQGKGKRFPWMEIYPGGIRAEIKMRIDAGQTKDRIKLDMKATALAKGYAYGFARRFNSHYDAVWKQMLKETGKVETKPEPAPATIEPTVINAQVESQPEQKQEGSQ